MRGGEWSGQSPKIHDDLTFFIFIEIRSSTSLLKADSSLFAIRPTTVVTSANLMIHIIRREGGGAGFIVVG